MLNHYKRIVSNMLILVTICILAPTTAYAGSNEENYIEYHNQINFNNIDYAVVNSEKVIFSVDKSKNFFERIRAEKDIKVLNEYFENNNEAEKDFIEELNNDCPVLAVSYTLAPLVFIEDHYERIEAQSNGGISTYNTGDLSKEANGNFALQTTITKTSVKNSAGEYTYNTKTSGYWYASSSIGGKNHPASGYDFIYQSVPSNMSIASDSLTTIYNYNVGSTGEKYGRNGQEYIRLNGSNSYIEYKVKDDPAGINQLSRVYLNTKTNGKASTSTRRINSYYVHTWKSLTVEVEVSAKDSEAELKLTPSIEEKSWQLYNYVSFNF